MSEAVFLRVLDPPPEGKGQELSQLAIRLRDGGSAHEPQLVFCVDPTDFSVIPESPFAYWVGEPIRRIFREFPPLEGNAGTVKQGLATADDFRFVRAWWEVDPATIGYSPRDTEQGRGWVHFAKGGSYSPYYADVHLVVNWFGQGAEIKNFYKPDGRLASRPQNEGFYFRPGLTWPLRTGGLSFRPNPTGSAFGHKGPVAVLANDDRHALLHLLAVLNSPLVEALVRVQLARTELAQSYEVGLIAKTPIPSTVGSASLAEKAKRAHDLARKLRDTDEVVHTFQRLPVTRIEPPCSRAESSNGIDSRLSEDWRALKTVHAAIAEEVFELYGFPADDRQVLVDEVGLDIGSPISNRAQQHVNGEEADEDEVDFLIEDQARRVANLLMWCVGVAFGRWDVRMAKDESLISELQGPFERLPRVAPGGLVGPDGLPASRDRIGSEAWLRARPNVITLPEPSSFKGAEHITAADYPVEVAWDGVLVDDPGHPRDIVDKVREVLRYLYGPERAEQVEDEALDILRADGRTPHSLRAWFRNQKATELGLSFFDFHIRRYSKSRRKAPIYWRLCTSPGRGQSSYGVWLYYHRLTDDTLWTVLNDYVRPRREREERRAEELRRRIKGTEGSEARGLEKGREESMALLEELQWFEGELRKVAERDWRPDLDDGVVINMAPFHPVVPWKEPEKIWKKLEKGNYDWAKLAMRYWPDRVREKCRTDKSLAIAHGLGNLHEEK